MNQRKSFKTNWKIKRLIIIFNFNKNCEFVNGKARLKWD